MLGALGGILSRQHRCGARGVAHASLAYWGEHEAESEHQVSHLLYVLARHKQLLCAVVQDVSTAVLAHGHGARLTRA
jgi:hypothetical protein